MVATPSLRQVNADWGERAPSMHFVIDQDRLGAIGLTTRDVSDQLQALLTGVTVTEVREDIRSVAVVVRSNGSERLDHARLHGFTLTGTHGEKIPMQQTGPSQTRREEPLLEDRTREGKG